jgi:hypothetical protein
LLQIPDAFVAQRPKRLGDDCNRLRNRSVTEKHTPEAQK